MLSAVLPDLTILAHHAHLADATIFATFADSDEVEAMAVRAVISTYKGSGKVFIHTSGTSVLFDAVCQMRIFSPSDSSGLPLLVMI